MRRALDERRDLMEARASALVASAVARDSAWLRELGKEPREPSAAASWRRQARIVAAYRDRYRAGGDGPALGAPAVGAAQRIDEARAWAALQHARRIAVEAAEPTQRSVDLSVPTL